MSRDRSFAQSALNPKLTRHSSIRTLDSDNSFKSATSLGSIKKSSSPVTLKFRGAISANDEADFFKFAVAPKANFSSSNTIVKVDGGNLRVSLFVKFVDEARQDGGSAKLKPGKTNIPSNEPTFNNTKDPFQTFTRIDRPEQGKKVKYSFKITFFP